MLGFQGQLPSTEVDMELMWCKTPEEEIEEEEDDLEEEEDIEDPDWDDDDVD